MTQDTPLNEALQDIARAGAGASPPDILTAQVALADIRLRIINGERVPPEEMRMMLDDLRRSRENTARMARSATAKAKRASSAAAGVSLSLDDLFPTDN